MFTLRSDEKPALCVFCEQLFARALRRRRKVRDMGGHRLGPIERYEGRRIGYLLQLRAADVGGEAFGAGQGKVLVARSPDEQQGEAAAAQRPRGGERGGP